MNEKREDRELSRQELYDRVWSTPGSKLAVELGISDVAISKRCKKLNVPRPSRGYWAKLAAGGKVRKKPLPPDPEEIAEKALHAPVPGNLPFPGERIHLHPVAAELLEALRVKTPDEEQQVKIHAPTLPRVTVSKMMFKRLAQALHVILTEGEKHGIPFRKSRSKYDPGYFEKGNDRLYLEIDEEVITVKRELTPREKLQPSWQQKTYTREPSGRLTFSLKTDQYASRRHSKHWKEDDKTSLEKVVAQVVEGVCQHYIELEKERAAAAVHRQKELEAYELEQQAKRKREHEETIKMTAHVRAEDLLKAAEWWHLHHMTNEFIDECEKRWREGQEGALTEEQQNWLSWARDVSKAMSPFESGYPDPPKDGAFDATLISVGGPYPAKRDFPRPPTMPKIPPAVVQSAHSSPSYTPEPQRYPFWLKYQGR